MFANPGHIIYFSHRTSEQVPPEASSTDVPQPRTEVHPFFPQPSECRSFPLIRHSLQIPPPPLQSRTKVHHSFPWPSDFRTCYQTGINCLPMSPNPGNKSPFLPSTIRLQNDFPHRHSLQMPPQSRTEVHLSFSWPSDFRIGFPEALSPDTNTACKAAVAGWVWPTQ